MKKSKKMSVNENAKDPRKGHVAAKKFLKAGPTKKPGVDSHARPARGTSANVTGNVSG